MFLLGMIYSGDVFAKDVEERITIVPTRTVSSEEESIITSVAVKVLRHIAHARAYIHEKDISHAQIELKKALTLIDIIKAVVPTATVKDRIWVVRKHLSYESTKNATQDLIPIYTSLDEIEDLVQVEKAREHINNAKKHLEKGDKEGARGELQLAYESLIYTEIDMPLSNTERHIIEAQGLLTKKELKKADAALKSAEHGIQFISTMASFPVVQARKTLLQATTDYATGRLEAARADIREAKTYLEKTAKTADDKAKTEAEKLLKDIEALESKMDKVDYGTWQGIKNLYARVKALTLSAENLFEAGGSKRGGIEKVMGTRLITVVVIQPETQLTDLYFGK